MKIISVEGVDYSGKSTFIAELAKKAKEKGYKVITQAFPSNDSYGKKAREEIGSKKGSGSKAAHYLIKNFKEKSSDILEMDTDDKTLIIFDRYVATTYAHQGTIIDITTGEFLIPNIQLVLSLDHKTYLARKEEREGADWDEAETSKYSDKKSWQYLNERYKAGSRLIDKWVDKTLYYDGKREKALIADEILELIS